MTGPLARDFVARQPAAAARVLERMEARALYALAAQLPPAQTARCIMHMVPSVAAELLAALEPSGGARVLRALPVPIAAPLLRRVGRSRRDALLDALPGAAAAALRRTLRYPLGTVGAVVDPHAVVAHESMLVGEAIALGRRAPELLRKFVYVIDPTLKLTGVVDVRHCLVRDEATPVAALAVRDVVALRARTGITRAAEHDGWKRFPLLPVVDRHDVFLGVLRRRDLDTALGTEPGSDGHGSLLDAAIDVAEVYWQASSELFLPRAAQGEPEPVQGSDGEADERSR